MPSYHTVLCCALALRHEYTTLVACTQIVEDTLGGLFQVDTLKFISSAGWTFQNIMSFDLRTLSMIILVE